MTLENIKLSIIIPVRNEGVNIRIMLKILKAVLNVPYEILIVYDFIEDDTVAALKESQVDLKGVKLVHNVLGKGVLNAIKSGIMQSSGDYILLFAVDEVGPVIAIDDMLELMDKGCDLVSCTRYAYGGRRLGGSLLGGFLSRIANNLLCVFANSTLTDSTTGIKMFKKKILDFIELESSPVGWACVFELAIKAQVMGLRLGEVPIISIDRLYGGKSTFSLGPWVREYLKWFFWGVRNLPSSNKERKPLVKIPAFKS